MIHWVAIGELAIGVLLSLIIGIEREFNGKAAGVRTCSLVGLGATLFTAVSRHGVWLLPGLTVTNVDGSRVAAQIVSGIGFLGAGLIFVRRDAVRGLTTAASIWLVAAVGMAAGAGVIDLAVAATVLYLLVVVGVQPLRSRLPKARSTHDVLWVTYEDGQGALRNIMSSIGDHGVGVESLSVEDAPSSASGVRLQRVRLDVRSLGGPIGLLVPALAELPHVSQVTSELNSLSADD